MKKNKAFPIRRPIHPPRLGRVLLCGLGWLIAFTTLPAFAQKEVGRVRVTGDRVNLRSQPNLDSTVLGRASAGQEFSANYIGDDWVQIQVGFAEGAWVAAEFLDEDTVIADRLRARAGPGSHREVRFDMEKGDTVKRTGKTTDGWVQIEPPATMACWISRRFISKVEAAPAAESAEPALPKVAPPRGMALVPLPGQGDVVKTTGVLRHYHFKDDKPSHYRLAKLGTSGETDAYFVHEGDLELRGFIDRRVLVKGAQFWVQGEALPLLVPRIVAEMPVATTP